MFAQVTLTFDTPMEAAIFQDAMDIMEKKLIDIESTKMLEALQDIQCQIKRRWKSEEFEPATFTDKDFIDFKFAIPDNIPIPKSKDQVEEFLKKHPMIFHSGKNLGFTDPMIKLLIQETIEKHGI